jgi:hypothetical protein
LRAMDKYHEPELEHLVLIPASITQDIKAVRNVVVAVGIDDAVDTLSEVVIPLQSPCSDFNRSLRETRM